MKQIRIPFLPEFRDILLSGGKTATARNKKYGEPGDQFQVYGGTFELTAVSQIPLAEVCLEHHKEEGFQNTGDFINIWKRLHPGRGYTPGLDVWFHQFRRVK